MVEDPATNNIISWGDLTSQDSFVVHRVEDFTTDILPLYFKHSNFCSFIRQVNTYGFTKTSPDTWEFQNPFFAQGRPDLLDRIERRTSVKRSSEKEEHGQEDEHRLLKLSKTAEQVEQLTRENKKLAEELTKVQQESVMNEQLVKQFLLELKASKQRQREMQEREEKLLGVLRDMASGGASADSSALAHLQSHHDQQTSAAQQHLPGRIQMPPSAHRHPVDVLDLHADMVTAETDFDLEAYMLKLGLSAAGGGGADGQHQQHQHQHLQTQTQNFNPPSPFQPSTYTQAPATPPPSPGFHWNTAPASPSYFFTGDNSDQTFKFGESYLSNAVGEVGWPTYSSLAQNVKQEPVAHSDAQADAYEKETCEEFLERYLDATAATFSPSLPHTPDSSISSISSAATPATSPFVVASPFGPPHDLSSLAAMDDHLRSAWERASEGS
ncbi:HSFtype DNA-binding domain containing protein [Acanthamoeba castellanii str. Neff]|uniref:HSFtype DNA-binding domain containing protein n=1 Tax=Acanthamoeba castellanii (strain ATCC 30010 / Neff) TaxID=1257118 RepID=L8H3K2_ACACF|nr:HSFtype DNA-binding domain containing protein [Acanthamoeba castellanii str. Neff]ELR19303.1 HSFtype DNA-binding domain containing protein [Acanthamoeba castellanii str. Neff]